MDKQEFDKIYELAQCGVNHDSDEGKYLRAYLQLILNILNKLDCDEC